MQFPRSFPPAAARTREVLARRPWLYWLVVGLAGLTCWWAVQSAVATATARAHSWGTLRTVWVTTEPVAAGHPWPVEAREYPEAMVPGSAVADRPSGVAGRPVAQGEVVVSEDLAAAPSPTGWVAMALPATGAPVVAPADTIVVFGNGAALCDGIAAASHPAGTEADGGPRTIDVWLPPPCAAAAAAHVQAGTVVLARRSGTATTDTDS